jgi:hypothetical protein|tara:strand:- start:115 stop:393 length:279 start_codon:yes stop_codon:yes gene_type:complete
VSPLGIIPKEVLQQLQLEPLQLSGPPRDKINNKSLVLQLVKARVKTAKGITLRLSVLILVKTLRDIPLWPWASPRVKTNKEPKQSPLGTKRV